MDAEFQLDPSALNLTSKPETQSRRERDASSLNAGLRLLVSPHVASWTTSVCSNKVPSETQREAES